MCLSKNYCCELAEKINIPSNIFLFKKKTKKININIDKNYLKTTEEIYQKLNSP